MSDRIEPLFDSRRLAHLDPKVVDQVPIAVFNRLVDVVNAILDVMADWTVDDVE